MKQPMYREGFKLILCRDLPLDSNREGCCRGVLRMQVSGAKLIGDFVFLRFGGSPIGPLFWLGPAVSKHHMSRVLLCFTVLIPIRLGYKVS